MIQIHFDEPNTENWCKWREACVEATNALNQSHINGSPIKIDGDIYKGKRWRIKKDIYFNLNQPFYGKCAYCEQKIIGDQSGDMEHYRPKGGVNDLQNKPVMINQGGTQVKHQGYYWLAYDWKNLLPSCNHCDTYQEDKVTGQKVGKGNRFPVDGDYAVAPGEESDESPLLLNPVIDDPREHLGIDSTGVLNCSTQRGKVTVDILGLNARDLPNDRAEVYDATKLKVCYLYQYGLKSPNDPDTQRICDELRKIKEGRTRLSIAGRRAIEEGIENAITTTALIAQPDQGGDHPE